jgi:hypothetical protein
MDALQERRSDKAPNTKLQAPEKFQIPSSKFYKQATPLGFEIRTPTSEVEVVAIVAARTANERTS